MKLEVKDLKKTYGNGVKALDGVSLEIKPGIFGLLGANGAGKSSLLRTLATLQQPDSGTITLGDVDFLAQAQEARRLLGYLPQEFGVYPKMDAETLLNHVALLNGVIHKDERRELVEALLNQVNLYAVRKRRLGTFSGGMRQRFGIAQALAGDPKLLITDEPTNGLDPHERHRFHNMLCELAEHRMVIFSTHIVEDAAEICDEVAVMKAGRILACGPLTAAIQEVQGLIWRKQIRREARSEYDHLSVISEKLHQRQLVIHVYASDCPGEGFTAHPPDLGDLYFSKTMGVA